MTTPTLRFKQTTRVAGIVLAVASYAAVTPALAQPAIKLGADPKAACAALVSAIPKSAIGLPSGDAMVESATVTEPTPLAIAERGPTPAARITPAMPSFCKVLGKIGRVDPKAPVINFQINLPLDWNGRSVQYGGGGFNGVLITGLGLLPGAPYDKPSPLAQGYVTYGTDSGHQNVPNEPPQTFALNDEALVNFAHASYKKVRDVAVAVMQRAYGRGPEKLYFFGSSEGGREGLTMAQRYPTDFDGIFSRVPVINWTGLQFAGMRNGLATMGDAWLTPAQVKIVGDAVLTSCDAADGVADGVVSDPVSCRDTFDVAKLQCAGGAAADTCLNAGQVKAVQTLLSPYRFSFPLANGVMEYPGWGVSGEAIAPAGPTGGWRAWWLGASSPKLKPEPTNSIAWIYGSGAVRYFYARNPDLDVSTSKPEDFADRIREVSALMDSTNPDLAAFHARGGKLIVLEHMADYAQSPYAGIRYFESVVAKMGSEKVSTFAKLYTAPGVDHVGSGAPALVDMLSALSGWVERGVAPSALTVAEQSLTLPIAITRERPLCEWPLWPRYKNGDANAASSFDCQR